MCRGDQGGATVPCEHARLVFVGQGEAPGGLGGTGLRERQRGQESPEMRLTHFKTSTGSGIADSPRHFIVLGGRGALRRTETIIKRPQNPLLPLP